MPKYRVNLSSGSFRQLAKDIREYRKSLQDKCEEFAYRLCEIGLQKAESILIQHRDTGQTIGSLRIENNSEGKIVNMSVVVESDAILFLEFGSGIKNSGTENPKASELGYGPGTYPGKGHWDDPNGWWYPVGDDEYAHTYGIEAAMPMYNASREMIENVGRIAKEVFGS